MNKLYLDPHDFSTIYSSQKTVVIAFGDSATRQNNVEYISQFGFNACDIYLDPDRLIPLILEIPCILRLIDYSTFLKIEPDYRIYLDGIKGRDLIPSIVYGANGRPLLDDRSVIDVQKVYPPMLSSYFASIFKPYH